MNRSLFIQLLKEPALGGREHEPDLRELVKQYPYFQAARIMLTRSLHNQNSYLYEKELKTTALYAGNRRLLYQFIHAAETETVPAAPAEEAESINPDTNPVAEPQETSSLVVTPVGMLEETVAEEEIIQLVVADRLPPAIVPAPVEEAPALPPANEETTSETETPVHIKPNEPHSFADWLQLMQQTHVFDVTPPLAETTPETEAETPAAEPAVEEKPAPEAEGAQQYQKNEAFDPNSIIERFISENPSISRHRAEFFNPVNVARQSVEEDEELVTETLARIYLKQGNYKKAIRIYEKLCLKFTDKMPYFVALIQKIRAENKID